MDGQDALRLSADTPFLADPAGQALCALLEDAGHQALFVGGCVRNAVMGIAASDVDISTSAVPQAVMECAAAAGLHAIPTGIDHGTVTVVVQGTPFEVTTFRRDVATDGRRAVVVFSDNIAEDAARRDFTMNALYANRHGVVFDPLGGLPDACARRVRFIQDPAERIREDYLRILRFFRFNAFYGAQEEGWDAAALAAISANIAGIETLSAERIGTEMLKLLSAPNPVPALCIMQQTGVLHSVLPGADTTFIGPMVHLEETVKSPINPVARLAALGGVDADVRLRLSRRDQKQRRAIAEHCMSMLNPKALGYLLGAKAGLAAVLLRAAMSSQPLPSDVVQFINDGAQAIFPVAASDLPGLSGPALGQRLAKLKTAWLASDLTKSKSDLLGA
jgi:tRNA nucleotidyltransferase/poly(A) polymerase